MAAQHGRTNDVVVLEVRPESAPAEWKPKHRFNLVGDRSIPFATYARMVVEAAQSLGQENDQNFFREQAERKLSLLLVTHDEQLAKRCQRRVDMDAGRLR